MRISDTLQGLDAKWNNADYCAMNSIFSYIGQIFPIHSAFQSLPIMLHTCHDNYNVHMSVHIKSVLDYIQI